MAKKTQTEVERDAEQAKWFRAIEDRRLLVNCREGLVFVSDGTQEWTGESLEEAMKQVLP